MEILGVLTFFVVLWFIVRSVKTYCIIVGIMMILFALPFGYIVDIAVNGFQYNANTTHIGVVAGASMIIAGIALLIFGTRLKPKQKISSHER